MQICCIGYCDFVDKHGEQTTDLKSVSDCWGTEYYLETHHNLLQFWYSSDLKHNSKLGAIQVLRNAVGGGGGGVGFSGKKR